MFRIFSVLGSLFLLSILLFSCQQKSSLKWEAEEANVHSIPFYKSIQDFKNNADPKTIAAFKEKHPHFMDIYFNDLLPWKAEGTFDEQLAQFKEFLSYDDYSNLVDTVVLTYKNTDKVDASIEKLLKHIKAIDHQFITPDTVYYFITGLNYYYSVILDDHNIGVGLDMFLGGDFPHYQNIEQPIPDFMLNKMESRHIPLWIAQNIYLDAFRPQIENEDLLSLMIQKGKEFYFLEQVLPDLPAHELFGYSKEQMKWAEDNERNVYNHLLQNELIYSKNPTKIMRYVSETHSTSGLSPESPGNLGSFIGWKIVRSFASEKSDFNQVLNAKTDVNFLKQSKYKP